ncbi:AAA family ATPase [Clostridium tarantellae]|uniref:DNA 3'-5' helicase n=2 Tax=Clostridium tarantellae TaxID=39493 RepID=A0A6I1MI87_9CLOT|nr:AAA family ATPase [Clostridium tarantellae]
MKDRIKKRLGGNTKCNIKTFHSFCFEIVKNNAKNKTDISRESIVFDEEDAREAVKKISSIQTKGYDKNFINTSMMHKFIDLVKYYRLKLNFLSDDEKYDYNIVIKKLLQPSFKKLVLDCFKSNGHVNMKLMNFMIQNGAIYIYFYNKQLRNEKALDFNDLVTFTKLLFEENDIVNYYKAKFKFINVDEVQDTSTIEYEIIEKLFKDDRDKNILLCGDIFQTIYKWRGSEPEKIFEAFKKECSPIEIAFDKNYRSTQILTDASMNFLKNTFENKVSEIYKEGITSYSSEMGEKISIIGYDNQESEAIGILNSFKRLALKGEDLSKACVLTRLNNYNKNISRVLNRISMNENFEFILVDEYKFFRRAEIKDIIAVFKILINPYDSTSLQRVIKRLSTGVGNSILEKIETSEFRRARIKLSDFISDYTASGEFYTNLLNAYDKQSDDGKIVIFDVESTGIDVTNDEIIQIAAVKIDNKGHIIDIYERFIKPNKTVGASVKVHGFTDEYLKKYGFPKEVVLKEFREYTKDKIVIGHNVQYDINILTSEFNRCNLGEPLFKGFYDTLDIYRRFYPMEKNHKLEYLSEKFNIKHKPSHNALDDIKATKELLVMAIEEKIRPTSFERMSLIADLYENFEEFREKYRILLEKSYELRPFEMILAIQKHFDIMSNYSIEEKEEKFIRVMNFHKILSVLDDNKKSSRDALISVVELTALSGGEIEEILSSTKEKPRIPIITVHQAKGLEYDTVIVSGVIDGTFPFYNGDLDEEGKLFYVAITRAKKRLILTYPNKNKNFKGEEYTTRVSPFIEKIDKKFFYNED